MRLSQLEHPPTGLVFARGMPPTSLLRSLSVSLIPPRIVEPVSQRNEEEKKSASKEEQDCQQQDSNHNCRISRRLVTHFVLPMGFAGGYGRFKALEVQCFFPVDNCHAAPFPLADQTATTSSKGVETKPIPIPPSSTEEGEADALIAPAAWPVEVTPGTPVPQQTPSAGAPSKASAASPIATTAKLPSPKRSKRVQRKGSPSALQKETKSKKKHMPSPRGGKARAGKGSNRTGAGTTAVVAETVMHVDQEQLADAHGHALESPSILLLGLAEEKRLADIQDAKNAKELAEEEECRRLWYGDGRNTHRDVRCIVEYDGRFESVFLRRNNEIYATGMKKMPKNWKRGERGGGRRRCSR